jgi:hypothetical protein
MTNVTFFKLRIPIRCRSSGADRNFRSVTIKILLLAEHIFVPVNVALYRLIFICWLEPASQFEIFAIWKKQSQALNFI